MSDILQPASYRALMRRPYFARMAAASLLARLGGSMWGVTLVLFVLVHFHSPTLAGITVLLSLAPGLIFSPLAGAILDRWGRVRMIVADYVLAVVTVVAILGLQWTGHLGTGWLLTLMVISSLSVPLGMAGARSLFPLLAPPHLWERANALDSATFSLANIVGPALAGILIGLWGPEAALVAIGVIWAASVVVVLGVKVVETGLVSGSVLNDAWLGLREVFVNPVLRAITFSVPIQNMSRGIFILAIPVFVLRDLHQGPQAVGWLLSVAAAFSLLSGILAGRLKTEGRERRLMVVSWAVIGVATASVALAPNLWVALVCMALIGLPSGLFDIPMFSIRQRSVSSGLLGRVLAVSMSFNFLGMPIGSGIGGPVVSFSPRLAFVVSGVLLLVAAGVVALLLSKNASLVLEESRHTGSRSATA